MARRLAVVGPTTLLFAGSLGTIGAYAAPSPTGVAHAAVVPAANAAATNTPAASDTAASHVTAGTAATVGDPGQPQPLSGADTNAGGANGQCGDPTAMGAYCSTRGEGTGQAQPSGNGNGTGNAVGKPCAGCVGKADNKNPQGQRPNGTDANAGYECDRNHGIGRTNPAHTGCTTATPTTTPPVTPPTTTTTTPTSPTGPGQGSTGGPGVTTTPGTVPSSTTTEVLGEKQTRTPSTTTTTPSVIGERVVRTPSALPFTGAPVGVLLLTAAAGLGIGFALLGAARPRRHAQH